MSRAALPLLVALWTLAFATDAHGQGRPRSAVGADFLVAVPLGDFGRYVRAGYGGELEARHFLETNGWLALRLLGGYVEYARDRDWVCLSAPIGCRVELAVSTASGIGFAGAGPELALPGPVSPYVGASGGFSYFFTQSSLEDHYGGSFGSTLHFSDWVPALQAGGGLRVRVGGGRRPIAVDLGGQYHRNGSVEFLRPQDIATASDGTLVLHPIRSDADLVTYRLGVTVGLGGGRGADDDEGRDRRGGQRRRH